MSGPRRAEIAQQLRDFREHLLAASDFLLEPIALAEQAEWSLDNGCLSHRTRGFFHVAVAIEEDTAREQLLLVQPQGAMNCLCICRADGRIWLLLQARMEPGNCGVLQFGPTVQSTPANYLQLHGGKPTRHLEYFADCMPGRARPLAQSAQLDLEKRYFQKTKMVMYVEADGLLETGHDLVWVPLDIAPQLARQDHLLTIDLRAMLSIFEWDCFTRPPCDVVAAPELPGFPGWLLPSWQLLPLEASLQYELAPDGIADREAGGLRRACFAPGVVGGKSASGASHFTVCQVRER